MGKGQGAGDQAQGVWDDLRGSRLDCKLLQRVWHSAGPEQVLNRHFSAVDD